MMPATFVRKGSGSFDSRNARSGWQRQPRHLRRLRIHS